MHSQRGANPFTSVSRKIEKTGHAVSLASHRIVGARQFLSAWRALPRGPLCFAGAEWNMRILLIEDDVQIGTSLMRALKDADYAVD